MKDRLKTVIDRYEHLNAELSNPEVISNQNKFRELSQERAALEKVVDLAHKYLDLVKRKEENEELISAGGEMAALAEEDLAEINRALPDLEQEIRIELLPKDPHAGRNVILEIRAGAGGDEASLFAQDLFRMYTKFANEKGWRVEIMNETYSEKGGYKEVEAEISGSDVYNSLKYESGVHRVQRIPVTESMGRVHTSTVTVAVLAEATEAEIEIKNDDLRVDTFRAGGKGGQHVNKTDSAVRLTHIPTDTVVVCQDERSQLKNRAKAMKILRARLLDEQERKLASERASDRKAQVGTGDRSERIRTYNYPQERVTDHRIGLTLKKLSSIMEGNLEEVVHALQQDEYTKLLAQSNL